MEALRPWSANEQYKFSKAKIKENEPSFAIDDANREVFEALCLYFSNDQRFEERGHGSLKKGLFLTGDVGVGKTLMMQAFSLNKRACFKVANVDLVVFGYQNNGIDGVMKYYSNYNFETKYQYFFQDRIGTCFDDLGIEEVTSNHFGNEMNVLEKIILIRYENKIPFHFTHFTSNFDAKVIQERYGTRVRSRLREMCNMIVLKGADRRKK